MKRTSIFCSSVHGIGATAGAALALLAVFALASLASPAQAAPVLPEVSYLIYPSAVTIVPERQPGTYFGELCSPWDGSCAQSSASAMPNQVLTVSGAAAGTDNLGANGSSSAQMTYFYSVNGPANVTVPLRISGLIDLTVEGSVTWLVGHIFYGQGPAHPNGIIFNACASDWLGVCQGANVHLDNTSTTHINRELDNAPYTVTANTVQYVELRLTGNSSPIGGGGGSYRGYLDPVIEIDPLFLAANPGYSLAFSAGLQTVPVPGALVLFGSAVALTTGWQTRRRRAA